MGAGKIVRRAALPAAFVALILGGCAEKAVDTYQGEFVMVAAANTGRLEKRWVRRGQQVEADAPLFALEQENERAARKEALEREKNTEARVRTAEARVKNSEARVRNAEARLAHSRLHAGGDRRRARPVSQDPGLVSRVMQA